MTSNLESSEEQALSARLSNHLAALQGKVGEENFGSKFGRKQAKAGSGSGSGSGTGMGGGGEIANFGSELASQSRALAEQLRAHIGPNEAESADTNRNKQLLDQCAALLLRVRYLFAFIFSFISVNVADRVLQLVSLFKLPPLRVFPWLPPYLLHLFLSFMIVLQR